MISNIGDAHIEYLGSREGILKAKCEIFSHLKENGLAVLNGDDALLNTVTLPQRIVRCGQSEHCQVRIDDIVDHGVDGITCTVTTPQDTYRAEYPGPRRTHGLFRLHGGGGGRGAGTQPGGDHPGRGGLRAHRLPDADHPAAGAAGCCWTTATTPIPSP